MLPAKKHCHPHSASNQGHCESSIAQFLKQITLSADFLHSKHQILVSRTSSCTYKHLGISPWKHTCTYSFYTLHRPAHRSVRTDRTSHRCRSRPGYHPTLSDGLPLLRPLLHCSVPAVPNSTPDFCCFPGGRSRAPLCIRRFCLFVFHKRMASRSRF